jgi:hypothetical protein
MHENFPIKIQKKASIYECLMRNGVFFLYKWLVYWQSSACGIVNDRLGHDELATARDR